MKNSLYQDSYLLRNGENLRFIENKMLFHEEFSLLLNQHNVPIHSRVLLKLFIYYGYYLLGLIETRFPLLRRYLLHYILH